MTKRVSSPAMQRWLRLWRSLDGAARRDLWDKLQPAEQALMRLHMPWSVPPAPSDG
ncbi:MAG: hypothetical protein ACYCV4_05520 [Dermatophilaceae bacterium]